MTLKRLKNLICQNMIGNTNEAKPYFFILGLVLVVAFLGFYFLNLIIIAPGSYENFALRAIIASFGIILMSFNYWPKFLANKAPLIFYFIIFFSFPFFFSFMLFKNHLSNIWQINGLVGFVLLSFFVDWIGFTLMSALGIVIAYLFGFDNNIPTINSDLLFIFCSYSPPVIYFIIFSRKQKNLLEGRNIFIKEIKSLNNSLEARTLELEKALAGKTEFLNNMSHEIRTPIHGFTNISEGLVEHWGDFDESKRLMLAEQVAINAKRLAKLIGHLLDLSKFSAGKMLLELKRFDLNESVKSIIAECKALYLDGKILEFEFNSTAAANIIADEERIVQVLRNLLINAIKFSNNNSIIKAELRNSLITDDDGNKLEAITFAITDFGIAIPEDELEAIFLPFFISTRTKTKAGGTGLGLPISKEIIAAHHGKIWAENNQTMGSKFSFILPIFQIKS